VNIDEHLYKAAAFERALDKLDPVADGELYAVFLMRAGTNRVNAALHALAVTRADGPTATHLGDLNHTYKPPMKAPPPAALAGAFAALAYIENLRPGCVRGATPMDEQIAGRARDAYRRIVDETEAVMKEAE
jgi:hypothetical protein